MKLIIFLTLAIGSLLGSVAASGQSSDKHAKKYTKTPNGYLLVLRQGDSVFSGINQLVFQEKIPSAHLSAIGFFGYAQFGYFNKKTKEYEPKDFSDVEVVSLAGSVAWEKDKPSLHLHSVVADRSMDTFGGHLLKAVVGNGSLEVYISVYDKKLERFEDPAISAKVLGVDDRAVH